MIVDSISVCFSTNEIGLCRDFYVKHFGAVVSFDCGWYVVLMFEGRKGEKSFISFMQPQDSKSLYAGNGSITLNFEVDNVDAEYKRLIDSGVTIINPLIQNDWGDRSFTVTDPLGNTLYIFMYTEPTEEYKKAMLV